MGRNKSKTRMIEVEHRSIGPTPERLAKAGEAFTLGGQVYTMKDSTLGRMYERLLKSPRNTRAEEDALRAEYAALQRYKHHWYHAGRAGTIGSMDLNRVFAFDPTSRAGMSLTEAAEHHRSELNRAKRTLGHRAGIVVDNVVCAENTLEIAGYSIGWASKPQAISGASAVLRVAGEQLATMWGIG